VRVLAYSDSLEFSGAERAFTLVVEGLSERRGFDVAAAVPPGQLADELRPWCSAIHPLPRVRPRAGLSAFDPRLRRTARAAARASGAHVILANLPSAQAGTSGLVCGLPSVAFLHIAHSLADAGFVLGAVRDRLAARGLRRATRIIVPAPSVQSYLWRHWGVPADRVTWAPPPHRALARLTRTEARSQLGVSDQGRLVGIVGRVSAKQKGHDVLLRALSQLGDGDAGVELVVGGAGRDTDALRAFARELGVGDRVTFLGPLERPAELYCAVDALVIPSRFEGLPLVALEALALGVPGIASAVDGLADLWPSEWLVPAGDPRALALALTAMLGEDPAALRARAEAHWAEVEPVFGRGTVERFADALTLTLERA
jgi:glycosyltransferase involved in cell wall biosynthesis